LAFLINFPKPYRTIQVGCIFKPYLFPINLTYDSLTIIFFNRQPATGNRQPATGNRQPATKNQKPKTKNQKLSLKGAP
jgi:hypothetical protein